MDRKDRSVSEVIGTIFVFAIFIALLTTLVAWYIPSTETSADQNYEANMINAMSSITSTFSNPNIPSGTQINQILPTGIAGTVVNPSTPTSVTFSDSGFSENASYGVGLGFYYLNQHPTAGVLNKVVGTIPPQNFSGANSEFYCKSNGYIYVAGRTSNNVAVISAKTDSVVKFIYAGAGPDGLAFDPTNHLLFVSDGQAIRTTISTYSTVSVISTVNNSYIRSINSVSQNPVLISPFSITYGSGNIYVASSASSDSRIIEISGSSLAIKAEVLNPSPVNELYFQCNDLIALDSQSTSYQVYGPNLPTIPSTYVITGVPGITQIQSAAGSYFSDLIFFSYNGSTSGGILATLIGSTSVISYYSFASNLYPYNITYVMNNGISLILHNSSNPEFNIVSLINFSTSSDSFQIAGNISLPAVLNYIVYQSGVILSSGLTENMLLASNFKLNDESLITVTDEKGKILSLYSTIYDNFFSGPYQALYNSIDNYLYISNYATGTVSVLSPVNCSLVDTIFLGTETLPTYMALNSSSGYVYVLESGNDSVAIINDFTLLKSHPLISLKPGYTPYSMAFDQYNGTLFVSINNHFGSSTNNGIVCAINGFSNSSYFQKNGYNAENLSFDGFNNQTYGIFSKGTTYTLWDLNNKAEIMDSMASSGISGTYSITFDQLDGYMFAVFSSGSSYGKVQVYTPQFILYTIVTVGKGTTGSVFDGGNNLLYVANYCPNGGNNITIINAESFTILTTIWVGGGPENPAFDSENGYIYIPDNLSNKLTIIDGGFTIYKGKPGVLESNVVNLGGMIEASGNTQFVTPVEFYNEGGFLIQNYSDQSYDSIVGSLPISVTNESGQLFFSFVDSGFTMPGITSSKTVSSTTPTEAKMQISNKVDTSYYVGDHFYLSDVFGNQYVAIVTGVFLEYFTVSIHSQFSSLINKYLFDEYNGSSSSIIPDSWYFSSIPMHVSLSGTEVTLSLQKPVEVYSASILFYDISVEAL